MRLRCKILFVVLILGGVFVWGRCGRSVPTGPNKPPTVLPKNDREQITIDPVRHTLTVRTQTSTHTQTLPDRKSVVDIQKDGTVKVTAQQFGFEARPFLGIGVSSGLRLYLGADLGYFKRANFGLGVGLPPLGKSNWNVDDIRSLIYGGYNVWDNVSINLGKGIGNKDYHAFLSVRL